MDEDVEFVISMDDYIKYFFKGGGFGISMMDGDDEEV